MSDYDGLRGCEQCGDDTTNRLCHRCREQEMIDNDDMAGFPPLSEIVERATLFPGCAICGGTEFQLALGSPNNPMLPDNDVYFCIKCGEDREPIEE